MVARLLCGAGADKDKAAQDDDTALIMRPIRATGGGPTALWSWRNDDTALAMSSRSGHLAVARLLCGAGADKDKAVQDDGTAFIMSSIRAPGGGPTALWSWRRPRQGSATMTQPWACRPDPGTWRWPDCPLMMVTQLLCGAGADKDKAEQEDDTALNMAPRSRHLAVAPLPFGAGADKGKAMQ